MNFLERLSIEEDIKDERIKKHIEKMRQALKILSDLDLVFKGGSSLMFQYGLDRFSEDLDFDVDYPITTKSVVKKLKDIKHLSNIYVKKDTDTTKRVVLHFDGIDRYLKIEFSLRKDNQNLTTIDFFNKIKVYSINSLLELKLKAFINRKVARDLYDIAFILSAFEQDISTILKEKSYEIVFAKDTLDLAIDYEQEFELDEILDLEDLFVSLQRLQSFEKRYKNKKSRNVFKRGSNER